MSALAPIWNKTEPSEGDKQSSSHDLSPVFVRSGFFQKVKVVADKVLPVVEDAWVKSEPTVLKVSLKLPDCLEITRFPA